MSSCLAQGCIPMNLLHPDLYPLLSLTLSASLACGLHSVYHFKKHISIFNYVNENHRKQKKPDNFPTLRLKVKHIRLEATGAMTSDQACLRRDLPFLKTVGK